ncbi:5'-3' exoribonuclease 4 isoform X1 [Helianthus annuus]|uniref:5'-3' exoribonuclease 4 isoform X1 n=2 Tax=Helianthus annuus TaxID=4232 RepID=UPI000B90535E|nr:5'-3' exoribonuclease 4 isoform X1 [Helianthus annuus]
MSLYPWLVKRYPNTLCSVVEDHSSLDTSKPNPNGVEFDNLYIHLTDIIHTCFHPGGLPAPQSYDGIFHFVLEYIHRVFSIVRPRKLLYLALDGVAPRAKMNYQRIRRFRAAKEAARKRTGKPEGDKLDSNVITPGTEFMDLLSCALRYFVYCRMNRDPGWRGIKVILSDSTVVGDGACKIMSYIRSQRNLPGYDPNTRHCLYGVDADLIMLALATHEIHISILRPMKGINVGKKYRKTELPYSECMKGLMIDLKFELFNIWVLREYLEKELVPNVEGTDFDCLIDDFVFMCVFVRNDFLPRLPSLDVSMGGIELLLVVYQQEFAKMGYLTNAPEVNLKSTEHFLQALSSHENTILMKRSQKEKRKKRDFQDLHNQLKIVERDIISAPNPNTEDGVELTIDEVKIHDSDMEYKHYTMKFDCESHDIDRIKRHAVLKYTEGLCWFMHYYYYQQVPSWQWFYPYHYAPLASDFCGLDKLEINFTLDQPFKALDQLLAVLPAASAQALPLFYRELMTNESSPISDFYPKADAKFDRDGKRRAWQDVSKLPFIDESRLLSEIMKVEHTLTDEEKQRNRFGRDMLFVHSSHPLAEMIKDLPSSDTSSEVQIHIRPDLSDGMNGDLCISDKPVLPTDIPSPFVDKPAVKMNCVKSVDYKYPSHAHIPKLPCGVIMPPRILRRRDWPSPPIVWHAFQSQRPTKKRKQDDKNCVLEDDGKQQNHKNGKSEAQFVVEGSQNHLTAEKSTNHTEAQQQQAGMSDGMCRDHKQVKETEDEKLIDVAFTAGDGEPKRKHKKKKQKQLDAQQEVQADGHEEGGDAPQGINNMVNSVEDPTARTQSSNNQQAPHVALKLTKRRRAKTEMVLINGGGGENKMESPAAAEAVGGENSTNKMDGVGDGPKDLVVGQMKDYFQVSEEKANKKTRKKVKNENDESKASDVSTEQEKESSKRRKKHKSKSKNVEIPGNSPRAEEQEATEKKEAVTESEPTQEAAE